MSSPGNPKSWGPTRLKVIDLDAIAVHDYSPVWRAYVPPGEAWKITAVRFQLNTGANACDRYMYFQYDGTIGGTGPGTGVDVDIAASAWSYSANIANTAYRNYGGLGQAPPPFVIAQANGPTPSFWTPLPDILLAPGMSIYPMVGHENGSYTDGTDTFSTDVLIEVYPEIDYTMYYNTNGTGPAGSVRVTP